MRTASAAANRKRLGCAGKQRTGPQLMVTACWQLGTGWLWGYRVGRGAGSERRAALGLIRGWPTAALRRADAGFAGFEFIRRLRARDVSFVLRVGGNPRLPKKLGAYEREGPDAVRLWPENQHGTPRSRGG